jgi:hypothetical protein
VLVKKWIAGRRGFDRLRKGRGRFIASFRRVAYPDVVAGGSFATSVASSALFALGVQMDRGRGRRSRSKVNVEAGGARLGLGGWSNAAAPLSFLLKAPIFPIALTTAQYLIIIKQIDWKVGAHGDWLNLRTFSLSRQCQNGRDHRLTVATISIKLDLSTHRQMSH